VSLVSFVLTERVMNIDNRSSRLLNNAA
jgi:hypothetical protein